MWNDAIAMAEKANDTPMVMQYKGKASGAYWLAGDKGKAVEVSRKIYKLCKEIGADSLAARELATTITYNLEKNSLEEAKHEIDEYMSKSGLIDNSGNLQKGCELFYCDLGEYYTKVNMCDSALYYYRKLITYDDEILNLENGYKGLMNVYSKQHQPDSVAKYAELYANANDTANIRNSAKEIGRAQSLYNYSFHQQKALEKSEEVKRLWQILFFCLMAFVVAASFHKRYTAKMQKKIVELDSRYARALNDYNNAIAEYNRYKAEGTSYEESLKAKIKRLEDTLSTYNDDFDSDKLASETTLQQHPIVTVMHDYAMKVAMPTAGEWHVLTTAVAKCLPEFFDALQGLTPEEQKLCTLTRLNFTPTDISNLMNIKRQRVTNIRSILNKKMFNAEGAKTFSDNIASL